MRGTLLAIQIDGMKMTAALNENGERRDRRQMTMRFDAAGFQEILASLTESWPQPDKVAVATTGSVRKGRLQSLNPDSIPFWRSFPLAEEIARRDEEWAAADAYAEGFDDAQDYPPEPD